MSLVGGILVGWGLSQLAIHVRHCRETYWARGDGWIVGLLLFIAGVGATLIVLAS